MNDKMREQFENQLTYLPEVNQQALKSFDWATELLGIGKNYGLHIDQLQDLQLETMFVLVGLVNAKDYENEVITRLAISPAEADKIIDQVNIRIFSPIHDYIVNGGPKVVTTTPADVMESAGFQMTTEETPINIQDTLIRTGGETSITQAIPESKPTTIVAQPVMTAAYTSPLQFKPSETTTPINSVPVPPPAPLAPPQPPSKEKLEALFHDRQKTIDASIQSMDQAK